MARKASSTPAEKAVEAFADLPKYILDADGKKIPIPRLTARSELRVISAITRNLSELKDSMPASIDLSEGITQEQLIEAIPSIMTVAPDVLGEVGAALLHIEPDEVLDRFRLGDIVEAILPFFVSGKGIVTQVKRVMTTIIQARQAPPSTSE